MIEDWVSLKINRYFVPVRRISGPCCFYLRQRRHHDSHRVGRKDGGIQRRLAVRRHEDLTPLFAACPLTRNPLLAACLTRYSDVTLSRLAGDMFGCLPSHRPTFLSTKPQLLHPLLPVCCGAMGVPFDALYDIGMCTCTRLRSMTTTTITITNGKRK